MLTVLSLIFVLVLAALQVTDFRIMQLQNTLRSEGVGRWVWLVVPKLILITLVGFSWWSGEARSLGGCALLALGVAIYAAVVFHNWRVMDLMREKKFPSC